jgi:hypothetical protein
MSMSGFAQKLKVSKPGLCPQCKCCRMMGNFHSNAISELIVRARLALKRMIQCSSSSLAHELARDVNNNFSLEKKHHLEGRG